MFEYSSTIMVVEASSLVFFGVNLCVPANDHCKLDPALLTAEPFRRRLQVKFCSVKLFSLL